MITRFEVTSRAPFVGGAQFGATGAYDRIDGVATGEIDPARPCNAGIALLDKAPRNASGRVEYRTDVTILCPADPARGNGRMLYEVNNCGRMMLFPNLCAGAAGNRPKTAAELGNALPLKLGFMLVWSGWDPGAPRVNGGLALEAPVASDDGAPIIQRIREEFVSGTRLGPLVAFPLSHTAADRHARLTVRATQTAPRREVPFAFVDARAIRLLPDGSAPEAGAIYEFTYNATQPRVLGLGFAATRDLVSRLRNSGETLLGRRPTHTIGFGISQAGRYLRDHIALGFNRSEGGTRVFDGVFTHVAGIGRLFFNTPFAQPARTRTWHEDHDFPEIAFPFSTATFTDPIGGATASLLRGDGSDPLLIETNTATEYWQKGASLLHTDPDGVRDAVLPETVRGYFLTGANHTGRAGVPRDAGPCVLPRNWHDPMAAVRALLVALDEWVADGRAPPPSRLPRIDDGTLVLVEAVAFPAVAGLRPAARGQRRGAVDRLDRSGAAGPGLAGAGAAGRAGRQRTRRPEAAGYRRAARHAHRVESLQRAVSSGRAGRSRRHVPGVRRDTRRARGHRRRAAVTRRALPHAGGLCDAGRDGRGTALRGSAAAGGRRGFLHRPREGVRRATTARLLVHPAQCTPPTWCGLSRLKAGIATSKFSPEHGTTMW